MNRKEHPEKARSLPREWWLLLTTLLIFLIGLPAIFALPAERILFNPSSYKQALAKENAFDQFPLFVGQMIAEGGNVFLFGNGSQLLQVLQKSNYEVIIRQVFPQEWVRGQADSLIDQFWAYFNFQSPQLKLVVDFRPVKQRLSGDTSGEIAAAIMQGLPACSEKDILQFLQQALNGTLDRLPLCRPPEPLQGATNTLAEDMLKGAAVTMPDQLDLSSLLHIPTALGGGQVSRAWTIGFGLYHFLRLAGPWLPWVALLLLIITGVLAFGAFRGPFYWLGFALILPGLAALIIALLLWLSISQLIPLVIGQVFGANVVFFQVLVGMLTRVVNRFVSVAALLGLGVLLVGILCLVVSVLFGWKGERLSNAERMSQ